MAMNLDEFQDVNNIVDPNVRRKMAGAPVGSTPLASSGKRIVTPQEMGFTHEEPVKIDRPEAPILDDLDVAIRRKQNEARIMADAIEESDGEGVSEEEFQDLLIQAKDQLDENYIPEEDDGIPYEYEPTLPTEEAPSRDIFAELEAEGEAMGLDEEYEEEFIHSNSNVTNTYPTDEESYLKYDTSAYPDEKTHIQEPAEEPVEESKTLYDDPFEHFESGDINFDEEDKELDDNVDEQNEAEKEQKAQLDKLRALVREKIRPVSKGFDISSFTISKKPAPNVISTPKATSNNDIADWVLMNSQKPIYMKQFSGTEMERLANGGKGRTRLNRALDMWQLIYNHIVDPHKPETLEQWAKSTSFLDIDHIYMAIYRANFEGSNYIPYNCTNKNCKDKVFLSENFNIMDMCKFSNKEAKDKFNRIIGTETSKSHELYSTEVVPVSDDYAFVFREPSIYNIIFESAILDEEFVEKFGDLISICTYIDGIYYINRQTMELQPIRTNFYPNDMKKTVKARIIAYSKYISKLNSDQYNTLIAYMNKINESSDELTYQLPEVTCPACKTTIPAVPQEAQNLVFTRHQLAALANL